MSTSWSAVTTRSDGYTITAAADWNVVAGSVNHLGQADRCVVVTDTATTSISATLSLLTFASEETDGAGFHSTSSNTSRLTVPTGYGGIYRITANVYLANGTGGAAALQVRKNAAGSSSGGTFVAQVTGGVSTNGTVLTAPNLTCEVRLTAGDYVELFVCQTSGTNIALAGTTQAHRFGMTWVAA